MFVQSPLHISTPFFSFALRAFLTAFILFLLAALTNPLQAQDCGCNHTITASQGYIEAQNMPGGVKPGDVICIKGGVRGRLKLIGFKGTKDKPLTFKNCGGQVIFDNTSMDGTFVFEKSQYVRITGTGDPNFKYGFYIRTASKGSAMYVNDSDIEIDHVEIANAGFAGIMSKIEAKCDNAEYHRGNFVMRNMSYHDLYIHGTRGEGIYIGSSYYTGRDYGCGKVYSHEIHGLRVYNNIIENTGADGLQIGCATKDVEVYNNVIRNYGHDPFSVSQDFGLIINPGTTGKFYNNQIFDGKGIAMMVLGIGDIYLYNNLLVRPGADGIFIDERSPLLPNSGYHVFNNTIVNPGRDGIRMYSKNSVGNRFINNIVAEPKSLSLNYHSKDQYLYLISTDIKYTASNNLFVPKISDVKFVNPGSGNYQLQESSPAVDKGMSFGTIFNFDLMRTPRPQGTSFDIGAYEFSGNLRTTNALPVVSAGTNRTITLPTNSITLTGKASDTDGTITSVNWTKVSGPSASMSGTSSLSLALSNLVEGSYTFRLTATDNAGASAYSDVMVTVKAESTFTTSTTTNTSGLNAPTNLAGVADKTSAIKLSWKNNNGSNAAEHEIHMSVGNDRSYYLRAKASATAQAYTVTNLSKGQTYYFKVRARGSNGHSDFSNEIVFKMEEGATATTTSGTSSTEAPTVNAGSNQSISLPSNSVTLRGTASSADGSTPSVSWTKVNGPSASMTGTSSLSMTASNLSEGTYTFRLTAKDNSGNTAFSDVRVSVQAESTTTANASGLKAPSSLAGVADKTSAIKLSWKNNNGTSASEHEIHMSVGNDNSYYMRAKAGGTAQAYTVTNLVAGQTYYFKVRAKGSKGHSDYSNEIVFKMVAGAVSSNTDGNASESSTSISNTSNNESNLAAPSNLAGVADKTSAIKLSWKNNNGTSASEHEIHMSVGNDNSYYMRAKAGGTAQAYTVTNLIEGQTYYFRVRAKDSNDHSDFSNEIVFKMVAGAVSSNTDGDTSSTIATTSTNISDLNAPSHLAGVADKTSAIKLSWRNNNGSNAAEHEIHMSVGNNTSYYLRAKAGGTATAYTVANLIEGQTYYFKVRAKGSNGRSDYSNEIVFKMVAGAVSSNTGNSANTDASDEDTFYHGSSSGNANDLSLTVVGTEEELEKMPAAYSAYPNPTRDHINLRYENLEAYSLLQIRILDFSGVVRMTLNETTSGTSGDIRLDLEANRLPSGYYIIHILSEKGEQTIKFLKN
jgi:hypothetical protein